MSSNTFPIVPVSFWLLLFLFLWKIPTIGNRKKSDSDCASEAEPRISVIIPARNEENNLSLLLDSLSHQSVKPLEVIIADDGSRDGTASIALAKGARLLSLIELPRGWTGKAFACWQGALAACGEVFVFLDSDTVLEADGLEKLVNALLAERGLISVQPYHKIEKGYESFSSFFNLISFLNMNISSPIRRLNHSRGAFGPCLVCNRHDYFSLGGHEAVKGEIIEDFALAKLAQRRGVRTSHFSGKGIISFRMYPGGMRHLVEGWTKNFAAGAGKSSPILLLVTFGWIAAALSAPINIVKGLSSGNSHLLEASGVLYAIFSLQIHYFLSKLGNFGISTAVFYPAHLLFFICVFFRSLIYTGLLGYVYWRGRKISLR